MCHDTLQYGTRHVLFWFNSPPLQYLYEVYSSPRMYVFLDKIMGWFAAATEPYKRFFDETIGRV